MLTEIKNSRHHYFIDEKRRAQGEYRQWNPNTGHLSHQYFLINGNQQGEYKSWHANCHPWIFCFYRDHKEHGEYKEWYENGILEKHCFYDNGKLHGEYREIYTTGKIKSHCFYVNDKKISFKELPCPTTPEERMLFTLKYDIPLLPLE